MFAERVQRILESDARRSLAIALSPLPGPKALLLDDTLYDTRLCVARPLDLFTDEAFLREHGVRAVAPLSAHATRAMHDALAQPSLIVIIRGVNAAAARHAVNAIRHARSRTHHEPPYQPPWPSSRVPPSGKLPIHSPPQASVPPPPQPVKCLVLTTPRRSSIVEKVLKSASLSDVPVAALPLGFLPFDADLVTLDWPDAHRQIVLDGDNSAILASAAALSSLSSALNIDYVTIRSAGVAATAVAEELLETHGQMYPRGSHDGALTPSNASSVASSPATATRKAARAMFAHGDNFSLQDGGSIADSGAKRENDDDDDANGHKITLAEVASKCSKRRGVSLVIIDRGVDVVTPLLTQWTYEGLLEEAVGLHNNTMDLPISSIVSEDAISILSSGTNASRTVRKRLRGNVDPFFGRLRDLNYWSAARQISSVASSVRDYYDKRPTLETAEIGQMRDYVKGLREVKSEHSSAATHTAIAAEISARTFDSHEFKQRFELEREFLEGSTATGRRVYITDAIARGESLSHVIRLFCLWSVTSGGIDSEELEFVKREMLANFGLGVLSLLSHLERSGMLVRSRREPVSNNLSWIPLPRLGGSETLSVGGSVRSGTSGSGSDDSRRYARAADYSWHFARRSLKLVCEFDPEHEVKRGSAAAITAPYSGYTPLSVRLVEAGLSRDGWNGLPHPSLLPPGHATVEHCQRGDGDGDSGAGANGVSAAAEEGVDAVVLFVGGIARAEASAVRMAALCAGIRTVIATTSVTGPDEFVLSLN